LSGLPTNQELTGCVPVYYVLLIGLFRLLKAGNALDSDCELSWRLHSR
jgi:hypothetical protein